MTYTVPLNLFHLYIMWEKRMKSDTDVTDFSRITQVSGCGYVTHTPAFKKDVGLEPVTFLLLHNCSWFPSSLSQRHSRMTSGGLVSAVCVCGFISEQRRSVQ